MVHLCVTCFLCVVHVCVCVVCGVCGMVGMCVWCVLCVWYAYCKWDVCVCDMHVHVCVEAEWGVRCKSPGLKHSEAFGDGSHFHPESTTMTLQKQESGEFPRLPAGRLGNLPFSTFQNVPHPPNQQNTPDCLHKPVCESHRGRRAGRTGDQQTNLWSTNWSLIKWHKAGL